MKEIQSKIIPEVSVIIASFNGHNRIKKAIDSVLTQTYTNFELIIIDDASSPSLEPVIKEFSDPRIIFYRLENNSGCHAARSEAMKYARGEFIALLDDDDYWLPNKLELQLPIIKSDERIGLVCCGAIDIYPNGRRMKRIPSHNIITHEMELIEEKTIASSILFRKSAYDNCGGFDGSLRKCGDWDCWIRVSKYYKIQAMKEQFVVTTMRPSSLQRSGDIELFAKERWKVIKKYQHEIEKLGLMNQCLAIHFHSLGTRYLRQGQFRKARELLWRSLCHRIRLTTVSAFLLSCINKRISISIQCFARSIKKFWRINTFKYIIRE